MSDQDRVFDHRGAGIVARQAIQEAPHSVSFLGFAKPLHTSPDAARPGTSSTHNAIRLLFIPSHLRKAILARAGRRAAAVECNMQLAGAGAARRRILPLEDVVECQTQQSAAVSLGATTT
jgi:hypothetical protein